jgi:fibrillarin-like pre-rRNA processing protein
VVFSIILIQRIKMQNIIIDKKKICVKAVYDNHPDFDENIEKKHDGYYRSWDPRRSKLAAAMLKGVMPKLDKNLDILYLGASHGYTCSYVSDIIGKGGLIYAIDFVPRVVRDLWFLCEKRKNMIPIMADASQPQTYFHRVGLCDFIFQDVAQRNQVDIFLKNLDMFVKPNGFGMLAIKSRSIDITRKPQAVFNECKNVIESKTKLIDFKLLSPFEKDHCIFYIQKSQ